MGRSRPIAGACLAVLLACAGCGGSSSYSDSTFNEQDFDDLMSQMVIPALQLLDPFGAGPVALARTAAAAPAAAQLGGPCDPETFPDDVSATYCAAGLACRDAIGETIEFTDCMYQGIALNGHWTLTGTLYDNTATLALDVGSPPVQFGFSGTIASTASGSCVQESLGGDTPMVITAGSPSITIDGALTYCSDSGSHWPKGSREVTFTDGSSDFLYAMTFDSTNVAVIVVKDKSSGNILETCTTNLDDGPSPTDCSAG